MSQDASFRSLDRDDAPGPGPQAVLLCGLETGLAPSVESLLRQSGAASHRVVFCTQAMLDHSLGAALEAATSLPDASPLPPDALPQVVVLSGMTGRQIHGLIDGWRAARLPAPIWASTTPSNLEFPVRVLVKELLAERRAMTRPAR